MHEEIILELMSRIKKLEGEVEALKVAVAECQAVNSESFDRSSELVEESRVPYNKLTEEMITVCYNAGKSIRRGENLSVIAEKISEETGMNRSTAIINLYAVNALLNGEIYKRAISSKSLKTYFDAIFGEFGSNGLKRAISATRLHIKYRRECGHSVDSIEDICVSYEKKL